ncbi:MAG: hypothetical protein GY812_11170 [Actinomycetia bacterium]|nr:hypothetical protein [Actinomycetes bacterium]
MATDPADAAQPTGMQRHGAVIRSLVTVGILIPIFGVVLANIIDLGLVWQAIKDLEYRIATWVFVVPVGLAVRARWRWPAKDRTGEDPVEVAFRRRASAA